MESAESATFESTVRPEDSAVGFQDTALSDTAEILDEGVTSVRFVLAAGAWGASLAEGAVAGAAATSAHLSRDSVIACGLEATGLLLGPCLLTAFALGSILDRPEARLLREQMQLGLTVGRSEFRGLAAIIWLTLLGLLSTWISIVGRGLVEHLSGYFATIVLIACGVAVTLLSTILVPTVLRPLGFVLTRILARYRNLHLRMNGPLGRSFLIVPIGFGLFSFLP